MKNRLKNIVIVFMIVVVAFIVPIVCSKKWLNNPSQELKISEEELMNNLKELIPYLNVSKQILDEYKCQVSFYYDGEGGFVIDSKEQEQIVQIKHNEELLYNIKKILDNPFVDGITWTTTKNNEKYFFLVGLKTIKSGYISTIIHGNEGFEDFTVFLGDNWYYREMQGE